MRFDVLFYAQLLLFFVYLLFLLQLGMMVVLAEELSDLIGCPLVTIYFSQRFVKESLSGRRTEFKLQPLYALKCYFLKLYASTVELLVFLVIV